MILITLPHINTEIRVRLTRGWEEMSACILGFTHERAFVQIAAKCGVTNAANVVRKGRYCFILIGEFVSRPTTHRIDDWW